MEPPNSSKEVWICPTCGDEGFTNAFVYCVKCLNHPIHRYCLAEIPKTFDEPVIWVCEHCKPTVPNWVTLPKAKSSRSEKEEIIKTTDSKKKRKKESRIASLIAGTEEVNHRENATEPDDECIACNFPKKERTKAKRHATCLGAKEKEHMLQNSLKSGTQKACTTMADLIERSSSDSSPIETNLKNKKGIDDIQPSQPPCETGKLISDSSPNLTTNDECQAEMDRMPTKHDVSTSKPGPDVLQSVGFEDNAQGDLYRPAQPVPDPVWRGSFEILHANYDSFEGFVAHLSTNACNKVIQEANLLPSLLSLEMHPKTILWPKSFEERDPCDDDIALYFFPGDAIRENAFDHLVIDMIENRLMMRAQTENAELLIFTSTVLPQKVWRFQAKYYLWGAFRNKMDGSTLPKNSNECRLSQDSPNKVADVKKIVTRAKAFETRSPQSTLSNNGENGVDVDRESRD